jgi:hypothetical protein
MLDEFEKEDFGVSDDFGAGIQTPVPDADDFKIPQAADAIKPERSEAHREAQRKGALNQWQAKDRRDGVPQPVKDSKPPTAAKRDALEVVLLMQRAESPHIKKALDEFVRCTVDDLGGWPNLTAGQKALLVAEKTALLIIMACEERIVESKSLTDADGREHALLRILKDYLGVSRQNLVALGLGLRSRMPRADNLTIERITQEYARQRSQPQLVPKKESKDKAG